MREKMERPRHIIVPVMFHEHHTGCRCHDFEEMANYFEDELSKLDKEITVTCEIHTKQKGD